MTHRRLAVSLLVLVLAHMLSTALRTLPAISADMIALSLGTDLERLASLTGAYYLAFALSQIPLGIALDRFGIKPVSLALLAGTAAATGLAAASSGPATFLASQIALGFATSGMLMAPMTLAAREMAPRQFGLWSGVILALGNTGMLLSGSPLAWLLQSSGWRVSFLVGGAIALVIALLVLAFVPWEPERRRTHASPASELLAALRIGLSPRLRGIMCLAFVSLAATLVIRGLWGGPWLLQEKGLSRVDAGHVLELFTLSLIVGPVLVGMAHRRLGAGRKIAFGGHLIGAIVFLAIGAGASGAPLSNLLQVGELPVAYDATLFIIAGFALSTQPILYAMTSSLVPPESAGKALAAVNLAFFVGVAVIQSMTGAVASAFSLAAVFAFVAAMLVAGALAFWVQTG